jgi:hypothetical protein
MDQEVYSVVAEHSPNNSKAVGYSVVAAHSPNNSKAVGYSVVAAHSPNNSNSLLGACYSASKANNSNKANKSWAQPRRPNSVVAGGYLATLGNKGNSKLPMVLSLPSSKLPMVLSPPSSKLLY